MGSCSTNGTDSPSSITCDSAFASAVFQVMRPSTQRLPRSRACAKISSLSKHLAAFQRAVLLPRRATRSMIRYLLFGGLETTVGEERPPSIEEGAAPRPSENQGGHALWR